jgi:hypothetical protein
MVAAFDMNQLLILSGAYCAEELVSEFGLIPPAFLPVGGVRLYERQREAFPAGQAWMSVPSSYSIEPIDLDRLKALGIRTIPVQDGSSLGHGFVQCCDRLEDVPTHILYGDTLVYADGSVDLQGNILGSGTSDEDYPWHRLRSEIVGDYTQVLIGYLHVDDIVGLRESVMISDLDFIEGLYCYHRKAPWRIMKNFRWWDFGHIHTYFQSKSIISTARSFNEVVNTRRLTHKVSEDWVKIDAEAAWFENLPGPMRPYTAAFAGRITKEGRSGYRTEFLYLNTLADLYVFGKPSGPVWYSIFEACLEFLNTAAQFSQGQTEGTGSLYLDKTLSRLEQFAEASGFDIEAPCVLNGRSLPSLIEIALSSSQAIDALAYRAVLVHGDFCFSNVFYDFRARSIKVIDPRGINAKGGRALYGDQRYDVAKLHHSVIGGYDLIIAGRYQLASDGHDFTFKIPFGDRQAIQEHFRALTHQGIQFGGQEIHAISIHLFLSMLPLHADRPDRQRAFIANALRLFSEFG